MSLFADLFEIAENKEVISKKNERKKWTAKEYQTKLGTGVMLTTPQESYPCPVVLNPNLKGWHRIYLGLISLHQNTYTHIKLSGDDGFVGVSPFRSQVPACWNPCEYAQEVYWKSADLTDQTIILERPVTHNESSATLLWIRCEEMSEEEIELHQEILCNKTRCVQGHLDDVPYIEIDYPTMDDCLVKLRALKESNVEFCMLETWEREDQVEVGEGFVPFRSMFTKEWQLKKFDIGRLYSKYIDVAHEYGMKLYSATRMCMSNFDEDALYFHHKNFIKNNPQYYYKNRDGSTPHLCSYAYPQVQDYVLNQLKRDVSYGFDGVSMIFHRGVHIGFDQPVVERFKERYPDMDPYVLPFSDPRLHQIWCEFMTEFMRKVRQAFPLDVSINVIVDYGLETAKYMGLDVEQWAKEGLIDSVSQSDMETFEDLEGCMDGDVIDLERYRSKLQEQPILKRRYGTNVDKVCDHIPEYKKLEEKYGVKVYHVLPWVHSRSLEEYRLAIKRMQECGAKRFLSWNTNHMVYDLPETHTVFSIGDHKTEAIELTKSYRMLSINGNDMSHCLSLWKG